MECTNVARYQEAEYHPTHEKNPQTINSLLPVSLNGYCWERCEEVRKGVESGEELYLPNSISGTSKLP